MVLPSISRTINSRGSAWVIGATKQAYHVKNSPGVCGTRTNPGASCGVSKRVSSARWYAPCGNREADQIGEVVIRENLPMVRRLDPESRFAGFAGVWGDGGVCGGGLEWGKTNPTGTQIGDDLRVEAHSNRSVTVAARPAGADL